jgi:chromosome segregation ATPase
MVPVLSWCVTPSLGGCYDALIARYLSKTRFFEAVKSFKTRIIPVFDKIQTQAAELDSLRAAHASMHASLATTNKLAATLRAEVKNQKKVNEKATELAEACKLNWEKVCQDKEVVEKEKMEAQEETKRYKGLLTKRIQTVSTRLNAHLSCDPLRL